jgi:hypothetical protein
MHIVRAPSMAHGFVIVLEHRTTQQCIASSLSLLGPRQNVLIRTFCSDTLGSSLSRFTQRRALQTLYEIPSADI